MQLFRDCHVTMSMHKNIAQKFRTMAEMLVPALIVLTYSLSANFTSVQAKVQEKVQARQTDAPLCGNGDAPDYGLNYDQLQPHWTVGWEGHASERAVSEVDWILDELNADSIAQTMILILPQNEVGIRTNCAVHFLRYMQLGLPSGERKDNGFVFLIVQEDDEIDVHYAVGLGLPALTAYELTSLNRAAEDAYESTKSIDQALLTLVEEYDRVARSNYQPLVPVEPTPDPFEQMPSGPVGAMAICGQLCMGALLLLFLVWMFSQMGRGGGTGFYPTGSSRSWGRGGFSSGGFPSGRGRSSPPMRGGSGSGRSGRTN
jgi:hypothetical protein